MWAKIIFSILGLLLAGCTSIPPSDERNELADRLARARGWKTRQVSAGTFQLVSYLPPAPSQSDRLTIYIEGDGLSWVSPHTLSSDPTPSNPLALRLALAHPKGNVAYLGRPCQFVNAERTNCQRRYWSEARFADEVIDATNQAIDALKLLFGAGQVILVGYSGGGAVASLVSTKRNDVRALVTVAGNLDHLAWTDYQRISPLRDSLNPADHIDKLQHVPQWHFVGSKDDNVTPALTRAFAGRFPPAKTPSVIVIPDFDHVCCWEKNWAQLFPSILE